MLLLPPPAPRSELEALPCAELRARCRRALFAGARPGFRGPRGELRRAVRRFLRRHRRNRGALLQALRAAALSSSLVLALLGLSRPAGADYVERSGAANPLPSFQVDYRSAPALVDIDGDGDLDLFSGQDSYPGGAGQDGFYYWENVGTAADPVFLSRTGSHNPLVGFRVRSAFDGGRSTLVFADLDDDGDFDALAGEYWNTLHYFENVGTPASPRFAKRTGSASPFDTAGAFTPAPTFGDLDADGDLDLVIGNEQSLFEFQENTGTATSPAFVSRTGSQNPLHGLGAGGSNATPALADLDGDGDLDLAVGKMNDLYGNAGGTFSWFENTGSATSPAFVERTGAQNPLGGFDMGADSAPAPADLDGDGDLDLLSSRENGFFVLFENTGSANTPAFAERSGTDSPVHGFVAFGSPALSDLDADGDLDVVAGNADGVPGFFENTGSAASPAFADRTGSQNPFAGLAAGDFGAPAVADLDGDGDLDAVSGSALGSFSWLQNTGSASDPAFVALPAHPLSGVLVASQSAPTLADLDGDGDVDLVSGRDTGTFAYVENVGSAAAPAFAERTGTANPLDGFDVGDRSFPVAVDFDEDGDFDIVSLKGYGTTLFENTGTAQAPAFTERTGPENAFAGLNGPLGRFALGDLDGDGDLDAIAGGPVFSYFENAPDLGRRYFARTGASNPLAGFDVGDYSSPVFADLDGDGDLDAFSGAEDGSFSYFENTGTPSDPTFQQRSGTANPLGAFSLDSWSHPRFVDLDADGDLDVVSPDGFLGTSGMRYFENTGAATSPAFAERTGSANPFDEVGALQGGYYPRSFEPSFADLDGDGDLDFASRSFGHIFHYYENTGSPTTPAFVRRSGGYLNPLAGIDFGAPGNFAPVLVDLDGDGDSDLVSGSGVWGFRSWENTGTATDPAFVPAASPLQGLGQGNQVYTPTFADIDADGDLDIFFAHTDGTFVFFENAPPVSVLLPWWVSLGAALGIGALARRLHGADRLWCPPSGEAG